MKKILFIFAITAMTSPAITANIDVEMWTKSPRCGNNVFTPSFVKINIGDTVTFISKQKGHNSASLKKTLPKGAKKWRSKISKYIKIAFAKNGLYGYKCTPHVGLGMVGIIQVGETVNKAKFIKSIKRIPNRSKKVLKKLLESSKEQQSNTTSQPLVC